MTCWTSLSPQRSKGPEGAVLLTPLGHTSDRLSPSHTPSGDPSPGLGHPCPGGDPGDLSPLGGGELGGPASLPSPSPCGDEPGCQAPESHSCPGWCHSSQPLICHSRQALTRASHANWTCLTTAGTASPPHPSWGLPAPCAMSPAPANFPHMCTLHVDRPDTRASPRLAQHPSTLGGPRPATACGGPRSQCPPGSVLPYDSAPSRPRSSS